MNLYGRTSRMRIRLLAVLMCTAMLALLVNAPPPAQARDQPALAKIAPWVIEHTKDRQAGEFLVVINDQADLSGAAQLATKEEKGAFVFKALLAKAQAAQGPALEWLAENGIEHQSFYIVNMVWVKG